MARPSVKKDEFIGKEAYLAQRDRRTRRAAVHLDGRRPPLGGRDAALHARRRAGRSAPRRRAARRREGPAVLCDERRLGPLGRQAHPARLPADRIRRQGSAPCGRVPERVLPGHRRRRRARPRCSIPTTSGSGLSGVNILVCIKRVPMVGGKIAVTPDAQEIDTRLLGFTVSPHEECAVEEAVRIVERQGGIVSVLTLGPPEAAEQLRDAVAIGAGKLILLETDGREWGPIATAGAIVEAVRARRSRRASPTTSSCSATRPPTPATTRSAFGSPTPSAGRASPASSTSRSPTRRVAGAARVPRRGRALRAGAAGGGHRQGRDQPSPLSVLAGTHAGEEGRHRTGRPRSGTRTRCAKQALRVPVVERQRAEILGTGVEAVPALRRAARAAGCALVTVLCLVEHDGDGAIDASLRALSFAQIARASPPARQLAARARRGGLCLDARERSRPSVSPRPTRSSRTSSTPMPRSDGPGRSSSSHRARRRRRVVAAGTDRGNEVMAHVGALTRPRHGGQLPDRVAVGRDDGSPQPAALGRQPHRGRRPRGFARPAHRRLRRGRRRAGAGTCAGRRFTCTTLR